MRESNTAQLQWPMFARERRAPQKMTESKRRYVQGTSGILIDEKLKNL